MPSANLSAGDVKRRPSVRSFVTFSEWCARNNFSKATGWRLIRAGDGPKVTQLTQRRIGIREDHYAEWLKSRKVRNNNRT